MSDEDTDQSIFTERNTGSTRDLRDCTYNGLPKTELGTNESLPEILLLRAAVRTFRNDNLRERDDRADRQLPVMSLKLIVTNAKDSPETRSSFLFEIFVSLTSRLRLPPRIFLITIPCLR